MAGGTENPSDRAIGVLWGLYYALYHSKEPWWKSAPDEVIRAYIDVQQLHLDAETNAGEPTPLAVAAYIDPAVYIPATTEAESSPEV